MRAPACEPDPNRILELDMPALRNYENINNMR